MLDVFKQCLLVSDTDTMWLSYVSYTYEILVGINISHYEGARRLTYMR
jgi:hypothetical protein